jgi:NADPH:quinone reductase-like Zn-dependent oxidoreductase
MRAFVASSLDGIDSLEVREVPTPGALGPGQIRVALRAASLNYRDLLILSGTYREMTVQNLVPCSDGAGEVIETAADVWRVKSGDRVALTYDRHWIGGAWELAPGPLGRGGGYQGVMCEQVVVDQSEAVVIPAHLGFDEGATLPCAAVTAWNALCEAAPLLPGMVVVSEGGGGVSIFALQFAKLFGARVIMISSNRERCARMKSLGADETLDYSADPDWHLAVRKLTGGTGADVTLNIGGADTIARSLAATRIGGRISLVGLLSGPPTATSSIYSSGTITSIKVGSRQDFETMNRAIDFHKLRPVIDRRYGFEQFPEALRHLRSGKHFGKIVVELD